MSGGYFNYDQNRIQDIYEKIRELLAEDHWSEPTVKRFREALWYLAVAQIYAQRIDWLVSGDDSEDTFHARLEQELDQLDYQYLIGTC